MGFRVNSAGRVNQGHFSKVPATLNAPRSSFDRSFSHKTTLDEGKIYPILWEPILPGDTVNLTMNALARLATPIFPYMDNVYMDVHFFFVPNRLVWSNWERFQGAQDDPTDSVDFEVPSLDDATHAAGFAQGSIYDYFGLPTKVVSIPQADMPIALPLRAYNKIWNEWYRDQNTQDSLPVDLGDGPDTTAYALQFRNRRKDYFTSCLPWPQKGPAVELPLGSRAPVLGLGWNTANATSTSDTGVKYSNSTTGSGSVPGYYVVGNGSSIDSGESDLFIAKQASAAFPDVYADLTGATAATINTIREAIVLQQMLELDARGGTRYVEILLSRFGVVSPDFRLQRSEYLGGQTLDVNVNPIAQTSETATSPQGTLAGFATARGKARISHSFQEHGQLLGLVSFRADTTYQQGMSRHWSVRTRYDYYEPLAANLGEQAVLNKELCMVGASTDNDPFGYNERWAEYRYKPSYVTGAFRSNHTATLDSWHLALDFPSAPILEDLLPEQPPIDRIVAVPSEPHFILDTYTNFRHVRVLPVYSAPGLTRL